MTGDVLEVEKLLIHAAINHYPQEVLLHAATLSLNAENSSSSRYQHVISYHVNYDFSLTINLSFGLSG